MDVRTFYGKRFENIAAATYYDSNESRPNFDFAIIPPNTDRETDEDEMMEAIYYVMICRTILQVNCHYFAVATMNMMSNLQI